MIKVLRGFFKFLLSVHCKLIYGFKVEGKENIPKEGALIFAGNHRSALDPAIIEVTSGRHARFMAKAELKKNFIVSFIMKIFDGIYVRRGETDIGALKESLKTLKNNECLAIFPEGTRNGFEKNNGEMKNGVAYLALKTKSIVVPIGICGKLKPFTRNVIKYGKPIDFSEIFKGEKIDKEVEEKASNILKEEILKLTK